MSWINNKLVWKNCMLFIALLAGVTGCQGPSEPPYYSFLDEKTKLFGFKDKVGNVVVPPQFDYIFAEEAFTPKDPKTEFLVGVFKHGKIYRVDQTGALKFETVFFDNGPDYYDDGLARFIGNLPVVEEPYHPYTGGSCGDNCKIGFHDRKGKVIIQPRYDFASPFRNGYAFVCQDCWETYPMPKFNPLQRPLNLLKELWDTKYMFPHLEGGKWGAVNVQGEEVVPCVHPSSKEVRKILEKKYSWVYMIRD